MPTYEYACSACGHKFEEFHSITAKPVTKCPVCKKKKVKRLISAGAGFIFKGSGFYITDYRSDKYKADEKSAAAPAAAAAAPATTDAPAKSDGKNNAAAAPKPAADKPAAKAETKPESKPESKPAAKADSKPAPVRSSSAKK